MVGRLHLGGLGWVRRPESITFIASSAMDCAPWTVAPYRVSSYADVSDWIASFTV